MRIPKVSVGMVTWNRKDRVLRAIQSAYEQRYDDMEIVVIDADSADGTAQAIGERFPEVKLVRLPRNLGPPGGRNMLYANCLGEYIVNLDDDGFLGEGAVRRAVEVLDSDPTIGVVAMRQVFTDEPASVAIAPEYREVSNFFAGVSAIRRAMLERTGGYPEDFFLMGEETYLALRVMDSGYRIVSAPDIIMWHPRVGGSASRRNDYYRYRSGLLVVIQLFPGWLLLKYLVLRLGSFFLAALKRRSFIAYLRAVANVLWQLPPTLLRRKPCRAATVHRYFDLRDGMVIDPFDPVEWREAERRARGG